MTVKSKHAMPGPGYTLAEENPSLWVYLEHNEAGLANVSLELLGKARSLADESQSSLTALLIGHSIEELARHAFTYGVDEAVIIEDERLSSFNVEAYTEVATHAILAEKPSMLLVGATHDGRDLAGRLAVRLQTGLNADCTDLLLDPETKLLVSEVTGFGGGIVALLECPSHRPQISTVRPGVFSLPTSDLSREGKIVPMKARMSDESFRTQILEQDHHVAIDLTQAEVLICGGRGIEGDFESLRALADVLNGEVGATRPPVDDGYIERERQVGQTGVVCNPKIALCLGISGAFHFVVGIEKADLVIAVNSDPAAPIFEYADYGIVADANAFLQAFMLALEERREKAHV